MPMNSGGSPVAAIASMVMPLSAMCTPVLNWLHLDGASAGLSSDLVVRAWACVFVQRSKCWRRRRIRFWARFVDEAQPLVAPQVADWLLPMMVMWCVIVIILVGQPTKVPNTPPFHGDH